VQKAVLRMLVNLNTDINLTDIIQVTVSIESVLRSFYMLIVWVCIFFKMKLVQKVDRKLLMISYLCQKCYVMLNHFFSLWNNVKIKHCI